METLGQAEREDLGWRNRSAAVVDLDDLIGAVFAGLEELGVIDETIAFFSSDNGYHLGEKKMVFGKGHPYEPSVRLPMYHLRVISIQIENN
jgi:N-acetylglucosamine-6-sulfatase